MLEAVGFVWDRILYFSFLIVYSEVPRLQSETAFLGKTELYGEINSNNLRKTCCTFFFFPGIYRAIVVELDTL